MRKKYKIDGGLKKLKKKEDNASVKKKIITDAQLDHSVVIFGEVPPASIKCRNVYVLIAVSDGKISDICFFKYISGLQGVPE